jgi:hypothetical protein
VLFAAIALGFALAAVQIGPTWELKKLSQRASVGARHHPDYGNIPVPYLTQFIAPWYWYTSDNELNALLPAGSAGTNKVEAHLYFGMVPLALLLYGLGTGVLRDRRWLVWGGLGLAALVYTTGWLVPLTQHLPGFSFFMGPGRYGIVTTLAVALLAAQALENLLDRRPALTRAVLLLAVLAGTAADLWIVSRLVTYAAILETPPIRRLSQSPMRELLLTTKKPSPRLFCRGPNLANLLDVASTPPYLGIGPAAYFDPSVAMPEPLPFDEPATPAQIDWLQRAGVTHVLSFSLLNTDVWPVSLVWTGVDPFLNAAWARREPIYLYELRGSRGRLTWSVPRPDDQAEIRDYRANSIVADVVSNTGGRLILTDLAYPGWEVAIDEQPASPLVIDGMYRGVDVPAGGHLVVWSYRPRTLYAGAVVSALAACGLALAAGMRVWRRRASGPVSIPQSDTRAR